MNTQRPPQTPAFRRGPPPPPLEVSCHHAFRYLLVPDRYNNYRHQCPPHPLPDQRRRRVRLGKRSLAGSRPCRWITLPGRKRIRRDGRNPLQSRASQACRWARRHLPHQDYSTEIWQRRANGERQARLPAHGCRWPVMPAALRHLFGGRLPIKFVRIAADPFQGRLLAGQVPALSFKYLFTIVIDALHHGHDAPAEAESLPVNSTPMVYSRPFLVHHTPGWQSRTPAC